MINFKENLIFNMFKDTSVIGAKKFKAKIEKMYSGVDYSTIYRKILNYQIEKYGDELRPANGNYHNYIRNFKDKSCGRRNKRCMRNNLNYETNKLIERNEV